MLPMQNFHVALPVEAELNAQIEITNNLTVFVKLLDNQPPPTTATTSTNNSNATSAALAAAASTAGPVTTVGGTTVTQHAPTITGQSMVGPSISGPTITGPTITGPTIHINMPQNFQQSAPSSVVVPKVAQAVLKKVGQGSTTQPAVGKSGATIPSIFLPKPQRIAALQQAMQDLTSDPTRLLETHFTASSTLNDKVSGDLIFDCMNNV
jgi:hypothetical protein